MRDIAIRCEGLGKQYRIGERERYKALRDTITDAFSAPFRRLRSSANGSKQPARNGDNTIWALKEVSFEVKQGEVVGIIGRNGAGKSTLLKILSRITAPTTGEVQINGRVGSLLEVGTGFHPELTGRENILLNGAILGMKKADIVRRFDEIVAFAEVEKFIDTPVKRYSSGMYVRLAFAVAAHMEPEILVVDEVLAVGDAAFQKKCLGKMRDVSSAGRTVLFVSHNMGAIETLCTYALYLKQGRLESLGPTRTQVQRYISDVQQSSPTTAEFPKSLGIDFELLNLSLTDNPVYSGDRLRFRIVARTASVSGVKDLALLVYSAIGVRVAILDLRDSLADTPRKSSANISISGDIESLCLVEGDYWIGLYVNSGNTCGDFLDLVRLNVLGREGAGEFTPYSAYDRGVVELRCSFGITPVDDKESCRQ
jgi:lipopolysaccharide transport system ATP-binding protein